MAIVAECPSSGMELGFGEIRLRFQPKASIAGVFSRSGRPPCIPLLRLEPIKYHREWQSVEIHRGMEIMICLAQGNGCRRIKLGNDEVLELAG